MTTENAEHLELFVVEGDKLSSTQQPSGQQTEWLQKLRKRSLAHFEQFGLPTVKHEQWRYTNLRALKAKQFKIARSSEPLSVELPSCAHPRLVVVNGQIREDLSQIENLPKGIKFTSLNSALGEGGDTDLSELFSSTLPEMDSQHGFTALNTAHAQDGYVLQIEKNAVNKQAIEICYVNQSHDQQQPTASHVRNLIVAGENSEAVIIERHIGQDGQVYLSNAITEVIAQENAHLDHYKIQQESDTAFHFGGIFVNQAASSQVKNHTLSLAGLVTRNDLHCRLLGSGAHVEMNGLILGNGRQHVDNHTQVEHAVPHCTSDEYYRAILDDRSRSVFRGRIVVAEDAQQTSADQQNNNLLLSPNAEADCKPQLEIYADDVQCSHGATVGQLDAKSLFYLQSRGIDRDSAKALLTFAFANEVIERINLESLRDELTRKIAGELLHGLEDLV